MIKRVSARACVVAALCAGILAGSAAASDVDGIRAMFKEIDANGDRALQFSEIRAARAKMFDRMDINGNGFLDPNEIEAVRNAVKARQDQARKASLFNEADFARRARLMDTDGDGRISRAEFADHLPEWIRAADKNGDQTLSLRELRALKRDAKTANARQDKPR